MEQIIPLGSVKLALQRDARFSKDEIREMGEDAELVGLSLCNPAYPCSMLLEHESYNTLAA